MELEIFNIIKLIIFITIAITMVVTVIVNYYILKALKAVSNALDSLYAVVESIDNKLIDKKCNIKK